MCPTMEEILLRGRHLKVYYVGIPPFVIPGTSPPKGSDFITLALMAKHHGFTYTTKRALTFDWLKFKNGTSYGIVYRVRSS